MAPRAAHVVSPWRPAETWRALGLVLLGFAVVAGAWRSLAGEAAWDDQVPGIGVAIAGFAVGSFGAVTWLLRGRTAVVTRRWALLAEPSIAPAALPGPTDELVAHPTVGRFHRSSCRLASGKGWPSRPRPALVEEGRAPCGVCRP